MEKTTYGFKKLPVLGGGAHESPKEGMCIMELVSFINREPFSDTPSCTDARVTQYMQVVNDMATRRERVKLLSVIDRMFHTGEMSYAEITVMHEKLKDELWPKLPGMLQTYPMIHEWGDYERGGGRVWGFLYEVAASGESVDTKLEVLNAVLDIYDEVMGVEEILPQSREEIEKMLAEMLGVQGED